MSSHQPINAAGRALHSLLRPLLTLVLAMMLAACSSQAAREAEMAEQEAARVAAQQEAARVAQEQERQRAMEQERQRRAQAAEQARLQAQREAEAERREAQARARAEAERREREAAEQQERQRRAALAAAEAERRSKLQRIAELEQQIARIQEQTVDDAERSVLLREAIAAAEELLTALTEEQAKYENTDDQGNTVEPLEKDLIAELEARKNDLVEQASN